MTEQIAKMMKALDISEEEALQLVEDDKRIDKGEKLFELTKEQQKASKDARATGTKKPTVYKFDTSKKKRKENPTKQDLIQCVANALGEFGATDLDITNKEREMIFFVDGTKYKIVLSAPRSQPKVKSQDSQNPGSFFVQFYYLTKHPRMC